ncbi:MAG: UDP-N-acetylglucosamine 2-epimerase (non-hydrolyzing) [Bacilli bacterium]|nr:UDP-N-acetylglucosamine 2-epimerase (non-hydrolyzing) [Bacilli bacterium]
MKKVMVIFGTRPEAIKMCPVVKALEKKLNIEVITCVSGQHREMLQQVLDVFKVTPKYNLDIMKDKQDLFHITSSILLKMKDVIEKEKPDLILVHGDTSTTFASALAAFYLNVPVGHVEAGLRTNDIYSPFPEEFNRRGVSIVARYNFAPTQLAKENLLKENVDEKTIYITGNTAIDALKTTCNIKVESPIFDWIGNSKMILLTAHRRENWGEPLENIFHAVDELTKMYPEIKVVYPVHMNPRVRDSANRILGNNEQVLLVDPLDPLYFHALIARSHFVLTDSGGIQEEAPSLHKPVLVLRDVTERPEGIDAGTLRLVGTNKTVILNAAIELMENKNSIYDKMANAINPYGDGFASDRIADIIDEAFSK